MKQKEKKQQHKTTISLGSSMKTQKPKCRERLVIFQNFINEHNL